MLARSPRSVGPNCSLIIVGVLLASMLAQASQAGPIRLLLRSAEDRPLSRRLAAELRANGFQVESATSSNESPTRSPRALAVIQIQSLATADNLRVCLRFVDRPAAPVCRDIALGATDRDPRRAAIRLAEWIRVRVVDPPQRKPISAAKQQGRPRCPRSGSGRRLTPFGRSTIRRLLPCSV